jgi:anti-anti-sigma factor
MKADECCDLQSILMPRNYASSSVKEVLIEVNKLIKSTTVKQLTLDFSSTELVDSSGIGTLVSLAKETHLRGVKLILKNLNDDLFQLFSDTGLDRIFTIERQKVILQAAVDIFEPAIDIKLVIDKEYSKNVAIFHMSGVMNHPIGSGYFKQQLLLSLAQYKKIILDMDELNFIDSLSLSSILSMNNLLVGTGGKMVICQANYIIQDFLSTLNISAIIPLYTTTEEALRFMEKLEDDE